MSKNFKEGEEVKYVGKGFVGFSESNRSMKFKRKTGMRSAMVEYNGSIEMVYMYDIEKKEPTHKEISAKGGRAKSASKTEAARKNATAKRFSKQRFLDYLYRRQEKVQGEWGFSDSNGWAQVHGKGLATNKAYGEFNSILELVESITFMEIFPFGKSRLLDHLGAWRDEASKEVAVGDAESRARVGGEVSAINKIIRDIENKVM